MGERIPVCKDLAQYMKIAQDNYNLTEFVGLKLARHFGERLFFFLCDGYQKTRSILKRKNVRGDII